MFRLLLNNRRMSPPLNGKMASCRVWGWRTSFGISTGLHAGTLAALAFIAFSLPSPQSLPDVTSAFSQDRPELPLESLPVSFTADSANPGGSTGNRMAGQELPPAAEFTAPALMEDRVSALDFEPRLPSASDLVRPHARIGGSGGTGWGTGQGGGIGDGIGDGSGSGLEFFNTAVTATKVVYVIDSSGSMKEPHSEARSRLDRLKMELVRSIGSLPDATEFYVIFFNLKAVPMPAESLQRATRENKLRYLNWVVKLRGGGGTDPREAVKQALELKPDVIYLLTDGVFDDKVPDELTSLNQGRVAIHTFCLGDATGEAMLNDIANRNRGVYKFVP